jgi:hypothetical protein
MKQALKIGLLTTLGRNVGDEFIREGVKAILDRLLASYVPLYIDKHNPETLFSVVVDEVLPCADKYFDCDIFIQCGAPVYWHFFDGQARSVVSEWHNWLWVQRVLNAKAKEHPWFINLGAGSCQPWGDDGNTFVDDPDCAHFARLAGARAEITIVRDAIAAQILSQLDVPFVELPCPAFLAATRHQPLRAMTGAIGVNLMPGGGHFELDIAFNQEKWQSEIKRFLNLLRKDQHIVFIAHDEEEAKFQASLAEKNERVFLSDNWRDYLDIYSTCSAVIANRVHGAVCAAGFGVPSIIIGNDSRAEIGRSIGLPVLRAAEMTADDLHARLMKLIQKRDEVSKRLQELRQVTLDRYIELLAKLPPFNTIDSAKHTQKYQLDTTIDYYSEDVSPIGSCRDESLKNIDLDLYRSETGLCLSFKEGSHVDSLLRVRGLSSFESWGAWTDARYNRTCTIEFPEPLPEEFELKMVLHAFGNNIDQPVGLRIGAFETKFIVGAQAAEISLPVHLDGLVTSIEIIPPFPCSPKELGMGCDERLLGVGLSSLTISIPSLTNKDSER